MKQFVQTEVTAALCQLLADTYALYYRTQHFHWHVVGPQFVSLHKVFEGQYVDLAASVDEIAERIRALDAMVPISLADLLEKSQLPRLQDIPDAGGMLSRLYDDHTHMKKNIAEHLSTVENHDDVVTSDLLSGRLVWHEKTLWILNSLLQ